MAYFAGRRVHEEISDAYTDCINHLGSEATNREVFACVASAIAVDDPNRNYTRSIFLVYAASMVFFMQAGFAMVCAGSVRKKNVHNTLLKNLLDTCGASIAFFTVGYAFAFGGSDASLDKVSFVGTSNFLLMGVDDLAFWIFQYSFSAATTTIVAGTLAERCQMSAYLCYSLLLSGWVYPIIVHAVWNPNGFLSANAKSPLWGVGFIDFAGSGVVHLTGGATALFATIILGPRRGRFHDDMGRRLEVPREFPGDSVALQMLGTFILWYGWHGFNGGSALLSNSHDLDYTVALATANTSISGGAAGIAAIMANLWYLERYTGEAYYDVKHAMNGTLAGLVAITGGCGVVEPWAAVIIGTVAGIVYLLGSKLLIRLRLDDACDAIPVHGMCGCWGLISVGLFANPTRLTHAYRHATHPGLIYSWLNGESDFRLLGVQCLGMILIFAWVMCIMLPFFTWLDWRGWFRSDPLEEIVGLDTSYHGGLALLANNSDNDVVRPEYISAFQKKRSETNSLRMRKQISPEYAGPNQQVEPDIDSKGGEDQSEEDPMEGTEGLGNRLRF